MTTRWPPWTRIRSVPSGTLSMRATVPTTPTRYSWAGPGASASGSLLPTMTSCRSRASTSLMSWIERSCPTASGVSVSGNVTVSRSGSTGSRSGTEGVPISTARAPSPRVWMSIVPRGAPARSGPGADRRVRRSGARPRACRPRRWPARGPRPRPRRARRRGETARARSRAAGTGAPGRPRARAAGPRGSARGRGSRARAGPGRCRPGRRARPPAAGRRRSRRRRRARSRRAAAGPARGRRRRRTARPSHGACARSWRRGRGRTHARRYPVTGPADPAERLDQLGALAQEARVDRHRLGGRLAEVEALAEVDPELPHGLELVDPLDALGDDAALLLVGDLDERRDQPPPRWGVLYAGGHRAVDLAGVGLELLEARERLGAAGEVVERNERAALAVGVDQRLEHRPVGRALGADQLEADAGRVAPEADHDRPGGAHRGLDVEHRARVDVDEQDLALGHQRQADLERGSTRARIKGEQRVVRLRGGDQLGPAQLDDAHLAAHQRLAAVGLAAGEVDDRLEVRRHLAVGEELGEPIRPRAVEQRVGGDRQALLIVEPDREQAG